MDVGFFFGFVGGICFNHVQKGLCNLCCVTINGLICSGPVQSGNGCRGREEIDQEVVGTWKPSIS
jgi:hypothetical protein